MPDHDDLQQPAGQDEAALAIVARHALHDEELVAALAAGALDGSDDAGARTRARGLVERCPACRALHDDVAAITGSLHAARAFTATAQRDFRLTVDDANRLGGTVIARRVTRGFRAILLGIARPIGASVAALGMVGVLVGSAVLGGAGRIGAPAVDMGTTAGGAEFQSAAPEAPAAPGAPAAAGTFGVDNGPLQPPKAGEGTAGAGTAGEVEPVDLGRQAIAPDGAAWLLGLSLIAVIAGAVLFFVGVRGTRGRSPDDAVR